jgi:biotin transport system substrate-specific component
MPPLSEFFWALIGLILTIFGTFVEVFLVLPSNNQQTDSLELSPLSLGITYQLVGVFLTACVAGKNAATYAQIAYVILGLFKLPVFYQGGTFDYLQYPSFGYILGFIPGAWLCGFLVLPGKRRLELFAISSFFGLLVIHLCGILYLAGYCLITPLFGNELADNYLVEGIKLYSLMPFPSQLILICVVSLLAFLLRLILMY